MTLGDDLPDVKPYFSFGTAKPGEPAQRWSTTSSQAKQVALLAPPARLILLFVAAALVLVPLTVLHCIVAYM